MTRFKKLDNWVVSYNQPPDTRRWIIKDNHVIKEEMTNDKILMNLIIAIGYALDSGSNKKSSEEREESKDKAEKILNETMDFLVQRNPPKR